MFACAGYHFQDLFPRPNIAWRKGGTERIGDEGALARRGMSGPYLSRIRQEEWRGTMRGSRRRAINAIYHGGSRE